MAWQGILQSNSMFEANLSIWILVICWHFRHSDMMTFDSTKHQRVSVVIFSKLTSVSSSRHWHMAANSSRNYKETLTCISMSLQAFLSPWAQSMPAANLRPGGSPEVLRGRTWLSGKCEWELIFSHLRVTFDAPKQGSSGERCVEKWSTRFQKCVLLLTLGMNKI